MTPTERFPYEMYGKNKAILGDGRGTFSSHPTGNCERGGHMIWANERPGVYSDYDTSGILWGQTSGKSVGIAAVGQGNANTVHIVYRASDAVLYLGREAPFPSFARGPGQRGGERGGGTGSLRFPLITPPLLPPWRKRYLRAVMRQRFPFCPSFSYGQRQVGFLPQKRTGGPGGLPGEDPFSWAKNFACERMVLLAQPTRTRGRPVVCRRLCRADRPSEPFGSPYTEAYYLVLPGYPPPFLNLR